MKTWVTFIDKWAAAANTGYAEWRQQRAPAEVAGGADRDRRLLDLNEKFKDL